VTSHQKAGKRFVKVSSDECCDANRAAETIGLVAGWGDYPVNIAQRIHQQGNRVCCAAVLNHADDHSLQPYCHQLKSFGMAKLGHQARYFRAHGVTRATMAGKIFKTLLFEKFAWIRQMPDLAFTRHFFHQFITQTEDRNDDNLLLTAIRLFQSYGIQMVPATDFAPELLVKEGQLTRQKPGRSQKLDIQFGWKLAKQMGGMDVGQSVVVKGRAVLAVEAVEGTDDCIRRAGSLCPAGGFTVVKVAKPNQDMRFDVPTVGVGTLQTMVEAGGTVLAIEADKTIILDKPAMIEFAARHNIVIVAMKDDDANQVAPSIAAQFREAV